MPPYVDGHQHVHVYPRFAEAIAMVLQEYGITKTRFPSEDMDEVGWMNDNPRKLDTVRSVLAHARRIIAFTEDMRARAVALLQGESIPPITVISQVGVVSGREGQSTDFPHTLSHEIRETLRLTPQHRLLLLPSGLRPVASVTPSHR